MTETTSSNSANGTATVRARESSFVEPSPEAKSREARLVELREQFQSGRYKVNATEISSAIVGQHIKVSA